MNPVSVDFIAKLKSCTLDMSENFYSDWGRMQDSDEYETAVNLRHI